MAKARWYLNTPLLMPVSAIIAEACVAASHRGLCSEFSLPWVLFWSWSFDLSMRFLSMLSNSSVTQSNPGKCHWVHGNFPFFMSLISRISRLSKRRFCLVGGQTMELDTTASGHSQGNQSCHQDTVVNHLTVRPFISLAVEARRSPCSVLFDSTLLCGRFLSNWLDRKASLEMERPV